MQSKFQEMGLTFELPSTLTPIMPSINMPQHLPTAKPSFMSARPGALLAQTFMEPTVQKPQAFVVPQSTKGASYK